MLWPIMITTPFAVFFRVLVPVLAFLLVARVLAGLMRGSWRRGLPDDRAEEALPDGYRPLPRTGEEARIYKLAYRLKGRLTVSDVVVETGLGVKEAEQAIQALVDHVRVRMEVDEDGIVTYEFPEIIRRFEGHSQ